MKTAMIFGAGMMGHAVSRLLGTDYKLLGWLDNSNPEAFKPKKVMELKPDCVVLGVLDAERSGQMRAQLESLGYGGEIISPDALNTFDPRVGVMRLLAHQAPEGAVAELGVYKGEFARAVCDAFPGRELHLFDTFEGFDERDSAELETKGRKMDFSDTSSEAVQKLIPAAVIHKGWFPDSFAGCEDLRFAFVSLDPDLYTPTSAGLKLFWPRLNRGGAIMIHDCYSSQFPGVRKAVDEFCREEGIFPVPAADLHGSAILMKY